MRYLSLIITVISFANYSSAQNFEWAKVQTGKYNDMAISDSGFVYMTGSFEETQDFDPSEKTFNLTAYNAEDDWQDGFVQKLDGQGNLIWASRIGGTDCSGKSIVINAQGDIYVVAEFSYNAEFVKHGERSIYDVHVVIQKYNPEGDRIWSKVIHDLNIESDQVLSTSPSGGVIFAGKFSGTIDADPSEGVRRLTAPEGGQDLFFVELDSNGNLRRASNFGSSFIGKISVEVDTLDNTYFAYETYNKARQMDSYDTTRNISDIHINKFSPSGELVWSKSLVGVNSSLGASLYIDDSTNIYVAGTFIGRVDFDPSDGVKRLGSKGFNISNSNRDIFILKLNSDGDFVWVRDIGSVGFWNQGLNDIDIDKSGNIFVTGFFQRTVDFDPSPQTQTITSNGLRDIYLQKLDAEGNLKWVKTIGGKGADNAVSVVVNNIGEIYCTGYFNKKVDFDPSDNVFILESNKINSHSFLLKLSQP